MMNKLLKNQLKAYSMVAGAVAGISASAHSQIKYTDINPDVILINDGDTYALDLNNDSKIDFQIILNKYFYSYSYSGYQSKKIINVGYINPLSSNKLDTTTSMISTSFSSTTIRVIRALKPGVPVNSNNKWSGTGSSILGGYINITYSGYVYYNGKAGKWLSQKDRYAGLKLVVSGKIYYGWIRMDVDSLSNRIVIKDFAYRNKSKAQILTGDTGVITSVEPKIDLNSISVYHFNGQLHINAGDLNGDLLHVRVLDIAGKELTAISSADATFIVEFNSRVNQVVLVHLSAGEATLTKKIFVQSN